MKVIVFLLFVTSLFAQADFRNSNWGDTKSQVKKQVKLKPYGEEANLLAYEERVMSFDTQTFYEFNHEGKLYQAGYLFRISHTANNLFFDDYTSIKDNISKKYGKGEEREEWNNDIFKDDPGTALIMGHLNKKCKWQTPKSIIVLVLSGDNFQASIGLLYQSIEVKNEEKSEF